MNSGGTSTFQEYVIAWKRLKVTAPTTQVSQYKISITYCTKSPLLVRKLLLTSTSSGMHFEIITSLTLDTIILYTSEDILNITLELNQQPNIYLKYQYLLFYSY